MLGCSLAACAPANPDPRLTSVEPSVVTSLTETNAVVRGIDLDARARIDLDTQGGAKIDRGWKVRIDDVPTTAAMWIDSATIDITIPAGLAVGAHDVVATSPAGRELVLPRGLTVTGEPVGLALTIEDAPGGAGSAVAGTIAAGSQVTAFAVVRDDHNAFVSDVAVEWGSTANLGTLSAGPSSSVVLTAQHSGAGKLTAHQVGAAIDAQSGELVVVAGPATHIAIADGPDGTGVVIGDRTGLTTDSDGGLAAYAMSLDAFDNPAGDVPVTWSLTGVTGIVPTVAAAAAPVDFTTPGDGVLHATHSTLGAAATGTLTVVAGRAANLAISPTTKTLDADDTPFRFSANATDADGNATTNVGTLTWSIASGPITAMDPATGMLDPIAAGTGTVGVSSSLGPSTVSGAVVILPGEPASVVVSPPSVTLSADAAPMTFTAAITDADGNTTVPGTLTWSVASGPITAIGALTGVFDPKAAGMGTIAATTSNNISGTAMVTVTPGKAATLAITPPTLVTSQGGSPTTFSVTGADADANPTTDLGTLTWSIATGPIGSIGATTGVLTPTTSGSGTIKATSSYGPFATTGTIQILMAGALVPVIAVPSKVSVGQTFSLAMTVSNPGQDPAANVSACTLAIGGTGGATIVTTPSTVPTIAPGGNATLTWTLTATTAGTLTFTTCAQGTDAITMAPLSTPATASSTVVTPPLLAATITVPAIVGRSATFPVTMVVTNSGGATASGVAPSALTTTGTASVTLVSSPAGVASIAPAGNATFQWTYKATGTGTVQFHGTSSGTDAVSGSAVATPMAHSNIADIVEAYVVASDVFGDGSSFAFVTGYRGKVYAGPNKTGASAIRVDPAATNVETLTFAFSRDTSGNMSSNTATPYTSIGASGCTHNTTGCGPDNEDLRGLFTSFTFRGVEWLLQSGASAARTAAYVYMTTSSTTSLAFNYVDLSSVFTTSYGASAVAVVGSRLYIGTAGNSAGRSQLLSVTTSPSAPGLDAGGSDVEDMHLERLGGWTSGTTEHIDAIGGVSGIVYAMNKNAWVRATGTAPSPYPSLCLPLLCAPDWTDITPSASAYGAKTSRSTAKGGQLEPVDRAVPQVALFGTRFFVARNTTVGPQLWACSPSAGKCDSNDWALVAPNSTGDTQLTQFNDTSLTSITMLVATPSYLYVGFDSASGVQVFRTANPAATTRAAFEGQAGCAASNHPGTCAGYGGAGLGDVTNTRIFDGKALTFGTASAVWLTVGNGTNAVDLVTLP
ncbi:MAG TPA: CARDB domain-containing protein [Kofleriaceae bacterium]|nr:CARDB domain-containing protein [Kofleriaceae bacterium]